ncbi:uncharacterized protein MYCFIDRAFT_181346, partial [Pseudocercospora fijiensis CIRAD86]
MALHHRVGAGMKRNHIQMVTPVSHTEVAHQALAATAEATIEEDTVGLSDLTEPDRCKRPDLFHHASTYTYPLF